MNDKNKQVLELDLNDILPNRFQPRIKFNEEKIYELSQSIKEHGVIQPIIVRPIGDKYEIVTGERRYKASVLAGLETIPAIILDLLDKDSIEIALIENVQRENLSPIEEAISYKKILDMGYLTQEELAEKLGMSQSAIANKKRLLNLCDEVQEALMEKEISERHARSLLKIPREDLQRDMLYRIVSEKLTVRQLDLEIQKMIENKSFETVDNSMKEETTIEKAEVQTKIEKQEESNELASDNEKVSSVENEKSNEDEFSIDAILSNLISFDDDNENQVDVDSLKIELSDNEKISHEDEKEKNSINEDFEKEKSKENNENEENKEEIGENDNMNNMLNLDEQISYNNLKGSSSTGGGKFFGNAIEDDEEDENKKVPITENKSVFDFSTGTVSNNAQNNVTVTRNSIGESSNQSPFIQPTEKSNGLSNKMNDLLSPQGSSPVFENENEINQEHIFASSNPQNSIFGSLSTSSNETTPDSETSIFANLMKSNDVSGSTIDNDELQSFLDPSFVNGEKQNSTLDSNQINDSIFSKFIDEDFGGEINSSQSANSTDTTNDLLAKTLFGSNSSLKNEHSEQSTNLPELKNELEVPSILEAPVKPENQPESIFEQSPSIKIDSDKLDISNLVNSSSQTELITGLMASSKKPDLLAPMNSSSSEPEKSTPSLNSIFGISQNTEKIEPKDNNTPEVKSEVSSPAFDFSQINSSLTPDSTIEKKVEPEEPKEEIISIPETIEKPVFITATNNETNITAPETPIITDTTMSNLLSVEKKPIVEENDVQPEQTSKEQIVTSTELENEESESVPTPTTNNNIDIQPIIITDYNKQYDPVIPVTEKKKEPTIDFKQILGMIRDLSNKIEEFGYEIDTEEIDLENLYQVIFNITKK